MAQGETEMLLISVQCEDGSILDQSKLTHALGSWSVRYIN